MVVAMESLAFGTLPAKFCAQGCVKCSPASLSLRSSAAFSSSRRSECSSSSTSSSFATSRIRVCGSENRSDTDAHAIIEQPQRSTNGHATSNGSTTFSNGGALSREEGVDDEIWLTIRAEARWESEKEPVLASYFYSSVISHR